MKKDNFIAPSILSANFAKLGEEVDNVLNAGADIVHFDVMANHYVPTLTIGPLVCEALRNHGVTAPIDVHLMVKPVDRIIPDFAKAGADIITIHPEATDNLEASILKIKELNKKVGVSLNPESKIDLILNYLDKIDLVLIMSVNPGFGGQSFIHSSLDKIEKVRKMIDETGKDIRLEVDGGINNDTINLAAQAGADTFVAGSAIFNTDNYEQTISTLRAQIT